MARALRRSWKSYSRFPEFPRLQAPVRLRRSVPELQAGSAHMTTGGPRTEHASAPSVEGGKPGDESLVVSKTNFAPQGVSSSLRSIECVDRADETPMLLFLVACYTLEGSNELQDSEQNGARRALEKARMREEADRKKVLAVLERVAIAKLNSGTRGRTRLSGHDGPCPGISTLRAN